jgi:hypothetical protein
MGLEEPAGELGVIGPASLHAGPGLFVPPSL